MSISLEPYAQTSFNPLGPPLLLRRIFDLGGWEKGNWGTPPNPRQEVSSCTSVRRVARAKRSLPVTRKHPETPGRDKSLAPSSVIPAELVLVKTGSGNPGKPWRRPDQGHDSSRLYGTPCDAPAGGLLLHLRTTGGTGEAKLARDAQTLQTHGRDQSLATYLVIPAKAGIQKAHHVVSAGLISSRMSQRSYPSPRWERGACTKKRGHASTWPLEAASQIAISRVIPSAVP